MSNEWVASALNKIQALGENWDGMGAPAITPDVVQRARSAANALGGEVIVRVGPTVEGCINIYVARDGGIKIISICPAGASNA